MMSLQVKLEIQEQLRQNEAFSTIGETLDKNHKANGKVNKHDLVHFILKIRRFFNKHLIL